MSKTVIFITRGIVSLAVMASISKRVARTLRRRRYHFRPGDMIVSGSPVGIVVVKIKHILSGIIDPKAYLDNVLFGINRMVIYPRMVKIETYQIFWRFMEGVGVHRSAPQN